MATIVKMRARKLSSVGPLSGIGFAFLSFEGLPERRHISFHIGDHIIRMSASESAQLHSELGKILNDPDFNREEK